jgi:hypothetical protein
MKSGAWAFGLLAVLTIVNAHGNKSRNADSPSFGPQIGAKAPAFAVRDQVGHEQTNQTLKGTNGTVLLFFRSADW